MKQIFKKLAFFAVVLGMPSCFNLDEEVFDRVDKTVFYQSEASVKGAIASVYNMSTEGFCEYFFYLNEFSADQIAWRVWNGGLWGYDEAEKFVLSSHTWTSESKIVQNAWNKTWSAIGMSNNVINDLSSINPQTIGMTNEAVASYIAEMRTLRAWCYYNLFEVWGGVLPINTGGSSKVPPSADPDFNVGCKKIYDFISQELEESLLALKKNKVNRMNQAANRILKARLLLNSKIFINEEHYSECADICKDVLDGKYGAYSIADDFRKIYDKDNNTCQENVFAFKIKVGLSAGSGPLNMRNVTGYAYNAWKAFGFTTDAGGWNCTCIVPSHDNSGNVLPAGGTDTGGKSFIKDYGDKLGGVFDRFDDKDIRKKAYHCDVSGNWNSGIFLMGAQLDYRDGTPLKADADRDGQDLIYVDQVGTFQNKGKNLETVMSPRWGETNSGYRLVRYPVYPDEVGFDYREADEVEFRLSEAVYMLAECRLRSGDTEAAKELVNRVRKRYFSSADWAAVKDNPGPGFTAFDLDWMLSEWGKEFLGEGRRRRTDLRRFDKFTQGQWWFFGRAENYPAKRDKTYEWFPLPQSAISVNPGLVQNPNYISK